MSARRKTPLQRAGTRHTGETEHEVDEFRNILRRRQDAEEKLKRHLEGERDGRPVDAGQDDGGPPPSRDAGPPEPSPTD
ncbi:hypothetical protein [Arthrobacter sp.]|uniref:hypothetical protein n=1 Tax=Arthrobacter sp. TaxID=1667 RepID=UPI003A94E3B0